MMTSTMNAVNVSTANALTVTTQVDAKSMRKQSRAWWTGRKNNGANLITGVIDRIRVAKGPDGDWTLLAHHLACGIADGDQKAVSNLRIVCEAVLPGISIAVDKKQPTGLRVTIGDADINEGAVAKVMALVQKKVSLGGTAIKAALAPKSEEDAAPKSAEQTHEFAVSTIERTTKSAVDKGYDELAVKMEMQAQLTKDIAALQAALNAAS